MKSAEHSINGGRASGPSLTSSLLHNDADDVKVGIDDLVPKSQDSADEEVKKSVAFQVLKISLMFALWYGLNLAYNVYNKKTLNYVNIPWALSTIQLMTGIIFFGPLWVSGVRHPPSINMFVLRKVFRMSIFHCGTHISATLALAAGNVSSFHVLKAAEPFFTCVFSGIIMKKVFKWYVYIMILPIVGGVGYSALSSGASIDGIAFFGAMLSNLSSALRGIYGKLFMAARAKMAETDPSVLDDNLSSANVFSLMTIFAILITFPLALYFEINEILNLYSDGIATEEIDNQTVAGYAILSGVFYYTYNEVAFSLLDEINAVTHAVGNTVKRVVLIVCSSIIFAEPFGVQAAIGTAVAVAGVLGYSLAKYYSELK